MINNYLKVFFLCCFPFVGFSQNLIPNYSFEDTVNIKVTPLYLPAEWKAANREGWNYLTPLQNKTFPDWGAPKNFAGYQKAKTGTAYVGINLYNLWSINSNRNISREYLQVKLKQPLKLDSTYCFQLFMSLADSAHFASKNMLGIYFSLQAVTSYKVEPLPYTPQLVVSPNAYITDRINWVKIDLQYKALGGEEYVTIGNFNDTTYIDTVFVPGGGTQFWMEYSYYYLDDIWFSSCDSLPDSLSSGLRKQQLKNLVSVYPNPFNSAFVVESQTINRLHFVLYNSLGQKLPFKVQQIGKRYSISTQNLPKGLYWLQINDGNRVEALKLLKE